VRVNQLVVDPVPAALRQLVHIQLAHPQHHLAQRAANLVTVDVDVRKIVVRPDLLHLAQRVLQCLHVPQANILQRCLVVRRIGGAGRRLRRKFVLRKLVERVGLARHLNVVGNIWPLRSS